MNFNNRRCSEKTRTKRAQAAREPKIRWEVLGLPRALGTKATTSMDDIRQQASRMANSWLEKGPHITQGRPPTINRRSRNNAGL
ncbi:hypothetical protein AYO43_07510 [Nitrospira sp. SCGC AG-212-E16]|nr:hypothetical protein AYO43_07510 [Nitrospira sp. SCGC AG-212-E16]